MRTAELPARRWSLLAWGLGGLLLLYYLLPLGALFLAQSPAELLRAAKRPALLHATGVSLASATAALGISLALGVPLAYALSRARRGIRYVGMLLVALPLAIPPVVSGMLLLTLFGAESPVGAALARNGFSFARSFGAVVAAQVLVASPFVVILAQATFESIPATYAQASRTLGSGRWKTFRQITLPLAWPGLLAGAALCFTRAVGEFGAVLVVARRPRTLPVEAWSAFTAGETAQHAFPAAALLIVLALAALLVLGALGTLPWKR